MTETRRRSPGGADVVWEAARLSLRGIDVGVDALRRAVEGAGDGAAEDMERAAIALDAIAKVLPREDCGVLVAGDRVDEYRIERLLGHGGMAAVYAARRVDASGAVVASEAPVAIKVLPPWRAEQMSAIVRFRREAEATMRLAHPNVVTIHAMRESNDRIYYVMDLVPGGSLADALGSRASDVRPDAARVGDWLRRFAALADGLAHAHDAGIVHRDIKPGNILVAEDGRLELVDFGIARLVDADTLTATSVMLGTPLYMAPEQASGQTDRIGPKADVYSLGVSLFETLAGAPPYAAGQTYVEVLDTIRNAPPRRARRLNPAIPAGVEIVLSRCLEKQPEDRPTAAQLADALARLAAGESRPMPRLRFVRRMSRAVRRPNALVAAGIVLTAGLLATIAFLPDRGERRVADESAAIGIASQGSIVSWPSNEWGGRVLPDGRISFVSDDRFVDRIWITEDGGAPVPFTDPVADSNIADHLWSPDGRRCAILRRGETGARLFLRSEENPVEEPVAAITYRNARMIRWIGERIYLEFYDAVHVVDLREGTVALVTQPDVRIGTRRSFDVRPDEGALVFSAMRDGHEDLFVSALDGSGARALTDTPFTENQPRWLDGNRIVFCSRATGQNVPALLDVPSGRVRSIPTSCTAESLEDAASDLSALVLRIDQSRAEIWCRDLARGERRRFTADDRGDYLPACGGDRVTFQRPHPETPSQPLFDAEILVGRPARGLSDFRVCARHALMPKLSPCGRWLSFMRLDSRTFELWMMAVDGGAPTRLSTDLLYPGALPFPQRTTGVVRAMDDRGRICFVEWQRRRVQGDGGESRVEKRQAIKRHDIRSGETETIVVDAPDVWMRDLVIARDAADEESLAYVRWEKGTSVLVVREGGGTRRFFETANTAKRELRLLGDRDGALIVVRVGRNETEVFRVDRTTGSVQRVASTTRALGHTAVLTPDREHVLMTMRDEGTKIYNVWRLALADGAWSRVTTNDAQGVTFGSLATDGSSRLFYGSESQNTNLWLVRPQCR